MGWSGKVQKSIFVKKFIIEKVKVVFNKLLSKNCRQFDDLLRPKIHQKCQVRLCTVS